jgi:acyl carrier protein
MTRQEIEKEIKNIFQREFEVENPGMDDNLREAYGFDSIDAIELLLEIEKFLGFELTQEEKKQAMDIRTINQICDYVEKMARKRATSTSTGGK